MTKRDYALHAAGFIAIVLGVIVAVLCAGCGNLNDTHDIQPLPIGFNQDTNGFVPLPKKSALLQDPRPLPRSTPLKAKLLASIATLPHHTNTVPYNPPPFTGDVSFSYPPQVVHPTNVWWNWALLASTDAVHFTMVASNITGTLGNVKSPQITVTNTGRWAFFRVVGNTSVWR